VLNFRGKSDSVLVSGFIATALSLHSGQAAEEFRMCHC
jgi:sulfur transfer protein SufE